MKRRVLSLVLTLALCLNLCPVWVLAAEGEAGLCPHHPEHTEECGYAVEEPGAPCTFVCRVCPIEERMEALPASVSEENCGQVQTQLEEIYALYEALTDAEQQQVDLSPCAALLEQMEGLESEGYSETTASDGTFKLTLNTDTTYDTPYEVKGYTIVDTQSFTLTGKGESVLQVNEEGVLELRGKIVGDGYDNDAGVEVLEGGVLTVLDEGTNVWGELYGLKLASGAVAHLSAGTYSGNRAAIYAEDGNYAALLEKGCAFFDESGNPILPADAGTVEQLTVKQCTGHEGRTCSHNEGSPTHTWTCPACGLEEIENCTFTFGDDGTGTCEFCGGTIKIAVDEHDLADLVYDGTLQPEEVGVTVTLTDGSNRVLVKDTDYSVVIDSITDAGQATVTVTGKTFNGTFVKTYTVKQDKPGLSWANSDPVTVSYDGEPVETTDLPDVEIKIVSEVDHLEGYLEYSYKEQDDTDYTDGLPTNAGTYNVIVKLPELPNFEGAVSEAITLTVSPIDPIGTAPAAKTLTYNGAVQELVTGGTLNPVAVRDGLKIQFATAETGPFSTDIPTGINAGEYHVWYQVTGLTGNYIAPNPNPAEITGVEIQRKAITPYVTLSEYTYLYDGGFKQPKVTVKDDDDVTVILDTEYEVKYANNQNVGIATVTVTDKPNGNYEIETVTVDFEITQRTQDTLSITQKPNTITYGDKFTLGTTGGSGSGNVTWEITSGTDVAEVDQNSGQVTVTGHGQATVKATKSGAAPTRTPDGNYEDATDSWTFTAVQKPVTATVTADDKTYDGQTDAQIHATVEQGVLDGDVITITSLTGTFDDENAGAGKTVTVVTTGATISGNNSQHYAVSYASTTVTATIRKAIANITAPSPATLTYDGTAQALIVTGATVDVNSVLAEYALSEEGPYSTDIPKATNAGTYTVWYRVQETNNYTGEAPASVDVTIAKKQVSPTITLDESSFTYDGTPKEPAVTLTEADGTIPASEYTVSYSDNINVGTATVTATAKAGGNYTFENDPVTVTFTISEKQAEVITAPEVAGDPLTFNNRDQKLVTAGVGSGGTMVYRVGDTGTYSADIPTGFNAKDYTVYYKVQGDSNHSDSVEGSVTVTIAPKTVKDPTIELQDKNGNPLVSYTYDGTAKEPKVVVKDGSTVIDAGEYNIVYSDNRDAGKATVNITAQPNGNYIVTGSATFVINKADIVFNPAPSAADITYDGKPHELLVPGTTSGGEVLYALNSATSTYTAAIPTAIEAGDYTVYYKVTGDKNHNDLNDLTTQKVDVTIQRKPLTAITIELTPNSFEYDGREKMPAVTVKFTEGRTETVVPETEYTWACSDPNPTNQGIYTITINDAAGGNYDLSVATTKTATFTIGKTTQEELVIEDKPAATNYGDTFTLTASGGSSNSAVTWSVTGTAATVDTDTGDVEITGVGVVTITATNPGDQNYLPVSAQWTFTAAPKPVTASVAVASRDYDGTTAATVTAASITTINSDTVTIDPASITAAFDTPGAGTRKPVTLDVSKVQVSGDDAAKYAISYPDTVTADITQATTTITTAPAAIAPLTYNGQPQALVTAGVTNVGFLVYSLDGTNFSTEIPTGTNAGTYSVYYKVDGTADYTGVAVNAPPISVTIDPKSITPKIELSESSFLYDGTKKEPKITVKDGNTVLDEDQYTVVWNKDLTSAGTHTATISASSGKNYTFNDVTTTVEITPATQDALKITGKPTHVYYGDTVTTLDTAGGSGNGTVTWSITAGSTNSSIDATTGELTVKDTGSITVTAERAVPNYGTVSDTWTFTVEPKPVVAEVTVAAKDYDGTASVANTAIKAEVKPSDLVVLGDTFTISGLTGTYDNANAGTGKTVTLDSSGATVTGTDAAKYSVSYPDTVKADINPKNVTVAFTLSDHDLKTESDGSYFYEFDGTEKTPTVTVTADGGTVLADSDYSVSYANNKNVGNATVTVTAKASGNYTFNNVSVQFAIKEASAVLDSTPQAKDLTYNGTAQDLVTGGTATGGTVLYSETENGPYSATIPQEMAAGIYTVYYKVEGDNNHADIAPSSVSVIIKPKEFTPVITLNPTSYVYDGTAQKPAVTVEDGNDEIPNTEYTVSYRDNINAGTATVIVSDNNGGNYIVNGTATFEITKADPTVTAPTGSTNLKYSGAPQELVTAGVTDDGTVVYSVNGGNYTSAIPTASAVGTYTISWKVQGDSNHNDTTPATLPVKIDKNTVTNPTITLSSDTFKYNGSQQKPTITVYDDNSRVIPEHEYTVEIKGTNGNVSMVDADTYTVTVTTPSTSNYVISNNNTRTFKIVPADQETISITGTQAQVSYGDTIQLGTTGGSGGTISWTVAAKDGGSITNLASTISNTGLLTVKDVGGPITVTVTCSKGENYSDVTASWEFTAGQKSVTAVLTGTDRNYADNDQTATVTAAVPNSELVSGDSITISGLTGTFDDPNVGTDKKVTVNSANPTVTGTNAGNYDITYPATTTASILPVAATVDTAPEAVSSLTYDASQTQELVTVGTATGGIMVYSLDGTNFTPNIPKAKDAGTYTVYYKAQGDGNHTDSDSKNVSVTIARQTVTPQIELTPPSAQYDGSVKRPEVTVRDTANNVIPTSEYKATYVTDGGKNWTDQGTYTVKVEDITGGNYVINTTTKDFTISTTPQNPLEIVNKPGLVYYGDTFTLSAVGGSGSDAVTWSSSDENIAHIDANGFVTIKGTGPATITATKPGGGNYDTVMATYPLNALKKPITAIVTADDKVYDGNTSATIYVTWEKGALVGTDSINTKDVIGTFVDDQVGTGKTVNITGVPVSDATSQKYDITIPASTTASILKADKTAPTLTANDRVYDGTAKDLVTGGNAGTTLYSDAREGVYSTTVPTGTNAGTYTVWYKEQGDANHNDSQPQSVQVTISRKTLTAASIKLSGNDLQTDAFGATLVYYYNYDGTEKTPTVTIKDGSAVVPASEYTVSYSDNKNVGTAATVIITDSGDGNYVVSGSITFEIRKSGAQLVSSPQAKDLTYTGQPQELVTVGTATGGHIEYALDGGSYGTGIPTAENAGTYTVTYKVVGDGNHEDNPTIGSVSVTIKPKEVISPKITVTGSYTYNSNPQIPADGAVTVEDGTTTIPDAEYSLSYRDNVNAGTATVIVTNANGGNYIVNGTTTFEIAKADAPTPTAPTSKGSLPYNGTAQELVTGGTATGGTMVYALTQTGEYSPAIPTGKAVDTYTVWYKVQGDSNHNDSTPASVSASIVKNNVTNPTIQVNPESVTYNGEKQEPTVTVKDDNGLVIDGSEYTVSYADTGNSNNSDLIQVGTYTLTVTEVSGKNYTFDTTNGKNTATFTILPADQTPLTITGTRERVYYGDNIQLGTTGGNGAVTWSVGSSTIASITNGLLNITGVGSVTVTATSKATGYADQTATWSFYADKKPVTAVVTAEAKTYDGNANATVTATLQPSDFVGTDSFTITLNGCTFEDPNVGTDKKVNVVSTSPAFTVSTNPGSADNHENYAITYPAAATASILKANVTNVTAPTAAAAADLEYTGLPLTLVTAGTVTEGGTMEYSVDNITYSASLPTGINAGDYDVWYRVKGDSNHNDTESKKLDSPVTIAQQEVTDPIIEFTPSGASYDGQEHKPAVTVKDKNNRVIPDSEYTLDFGATDWIKAGDHTVTITGKTDGNYDITTKTGTFTISQMGQNPLSIVGQPGKVQYGDSFTLSTMGGSGTGTVSWVSSNPDVATIGQNGLVKVLKSGPTTITAAKEADSNHGAVTVTWSFSAEKKPVTPIVTAKDKEYDGKDTAQLVITWKDGDLLNGDIGSINLDSALTGKFENADVGTSKTVTITGTIPADDRYDIKRPASTTASITPKAASVSGSTATELTYYGSEQALVGSGVTATNGDMAYSRDGSYYTLTVPKETNAGTYTVYYKAQASGNYKDSPAVRVDVTIKPKTVTSPTIELSQKTFDYDGTAKRPDVVVKDGSTVIPASEYTVSYSNNVQIGTNATVNISDNTGGNYTVSGTEKFTIKAGAPVLTVEPQPRDLTYNGRQQPLVTAGTAVNGHIEYALEDADGNPAYSTTIPKETNAGIYEVWYKVVNDNGDSTPSASVIVEIMPKSVNPTVTLTLTSDPLPYTGTAQKPPVTVAVDGKTLTEHTDYTLTYSNNTNVGTATVAIQSVSGTNYQFYTTRTFEIAKSKAVFAVEPKGQTTLVYTGHPQELIKEYTGTSIEGIVLYSLNAVTYSAEIPTGTNVRKYTIYAKVQGDSKHEDSDVEIIQAEIKVNTVADPKVSLSSNSFPYTGSEHKPTVTVTDDNGNVIPASEYTVTYSNNINVGTGKVTITSKGTNYSFTAEATFTIVGSDQTPLTITGKQDEVFYGDTLNLGTTGGSGNGAVTWTATGPVTSSADGQYKVTSSGNVTITATKAAGDGYGAATDTWTFFAKPKPVTALVTAADKVYNGDNTVTLSVTVSGLIPGDSVSLTANGSFMDVNVGPNKTVVITGLNGLDNISAKYTVSYNNITTASITQKPAVVSETDKPTLAGSLTYNGGAQALLTKGGTADGGNLAYSIDGGSSYSFDIPKATDAGSYTVWYKVIASNSNYKDSAPVKLGDVTISANADTPSVLCTPSTFQYDGTEKTPTVVVRDSAQRIIPESEYTVSLPSPRTAVDIYTVTVTDKSGGNYEFTPSVEETFEIVAASQNPLSIITDKPTDLYYGDTFRLSAMGGSGSGAIQWSIKEGAGVATIDDSGNVKVIGTGGFTVEAYRAASDGYDKSNTDSVPFEAKPKPVTPVVTAQDKPYDGKLDATLTASWKPGDLVGTDTITLTVGGQFETADVGTGKQVKITSHDATGANAGKYTITWPESTTATISKVDAKLAAAPAGKDLTYTGNAQELVTGGSTVGGIGTIEYSLSQSGQYSTTIPTGTNAGKYTVWYRVADSVNYTGIPAAAIEVEIKKAEPTISAAPTATGTEGQTLSNIKLNGGATGVPGTFAWKNGSIPAVNGTAYDVIFTPNDTANYNTATCQVTVTLSAARDTSSNSDNSSSTPMQTTVRDGTLNASLSASEGSKLVREAAANQSEQVVIKPEVSGDVTKAEVSIPASTVSQLKNETNAALTVSAPIADVTIPNQALDTLSSAGGTVNVATEQVDQAVVLTLTAGGEKVEELPGGLTLSVPAEDAGPGTVAVLVHEDGTRETIRKSVVEDGMVNIPLNGSATVEIVDNSKEFTDVSSESWAADAVAFASAHELFSGTSETTFSPDQTMSRGMLTTVLYNLEGRPEQDLIMQDLTDGYSDVSSDAWYAEGVAWAVENGIASGYGNGEFGPNDSVTREQLAVMLWKYAGGPQASDQTLRFTDAEQASGYAQEALCWAAEKGILSGYSDGRLAPGKTATRAEAAQMLKNFMEST